MVAEALNTIAKVTMVASKFQEVFLLNNTIQELMLQYENNTTFMIEGNQVDMWNLVSLFGLVLELYIN